MATPLNTPSELSWHGDTQYAADAVQYSQAVGANTLYVSGDCMSDSRDIRSSASTTTKSQSNYVRIVSRAVQAAALLAATPTVALAQDARQGSTAGVSAIWIFANFSYAAMRAQGNPSGWRIVCFIFGFPGTLLSLLVVEENGERMYGFDLPKKIR